MKKRHSAQSILTFSLLFLLFFFIPQQADASEGDVEFAVDVSAAIAIDADTGKIFYAQNAEEALPIASTTKLLTMYLILEAIDNGSLSWDEEIIISKHLEELSHNINLSNVFLFENYAYSVRDLFIATEKVSANAAAVALAERIAGSEPAFVELMRAKLNSWGIRSGYIISASGINNDDALGQIFPGSQPGEENLMSARDLSIVAYHLIKDFPEILDYTSKKSEIFAAETEFETLLVGTNQLLEDQKFYKEGVDGLKTGTTELAGTCFVGTIAKEDRRVITVVLNVETFEEDSGKRFIETGRLMDHALNDWEYALVYPKNSPIPSLDDVIVKNSIQETASLRLKDDIFMWVNKKQPGDLSLRFEPEASGTDIDGNLQAPIAKDEYIGNIIIESPSHSMDTVFFAGQTLTAAVYADQDIEVLPWYLKVWQSIQNFFDNLF
ncbi:serine hydrolase [Vagococcus elongatus]|nr:serine hydrolase [Vagococcus elongatus]